jgi:hypothetical protein
MFHSYATVLMFAGLFQGLRVWADRKLMPVLGLLAILDWIIAGVGGWAVLYEIRNRPSHADGHWINWLGALGLLLILHFLIHEGAKRRRQRKLGLEFKQ